MNRSAKTLTATSRSKVLSAAGMCLLLLWGQTAPILANPTGGSVASGKASIGTSGSTETINQTSRDAIINWQTFSINSGETTKFLVPNSSSATLNRVMGGNASAIYGSLESNGKIILINPNGILIGPSGRIDTASFLGSTLDITDADFLKNGNLSFVGTGGSIENDGSIQASTGDVYLLATQVTNAGSIKAAHGTVGLAAGTNILLQTKGDQHLFIQPGTASGMAATGVTQSGTIQAATAELKAAGGNAYALAINNSGTITATGFKRVGGEVMLTADSGAITNSGSIRATNGKKGGKITLASVTGTITNSGTLDASATGAGEEGGSVMLKSTSGSVVNTSTGQLAAHGGVGGQGGQVEMSGGSVQALGLVDTTSVNGTTGMFTIDPATFTVAASGGDETGAQVDAMLATTDVTLNADNAVTINDGITWTSTNTLTLSTNTTGSTISINAPITGLNGGLTLNAAGQGDAITASGAVAVANFNLQSGTWTQNTGALPTFAASHDFEVQSGATFLRVAGGTGGPNTPYLITDIYGLQGLASTSLLGADAQLSNNIDATGTATWNSGDGFVPIGSTSAAYTGTFNGAGNVVNGLTIERGGTQDVGLFGLASGVIENVGVQDETILGGTYTGGLVGALGNDAGATSGVGSIVDSYASGSVTGGSYTGGLVGLFHGTSIAESYSSGAVFGDSFVGGLVGSGLSSISNCYSVASVTCPNGPVGGLEGENYYGGSITDSYSSGAVSGTSEVGGLVGRNLAGNITACFFDDQASGQTSGAGSGSTAGITGDTTSTLLQQGTYSSAGWNIGGVIGSNTWVIIDGQTRPLLGMEYSTTINNGHQLQLIGLNATTLTANYTLGENIDLSGTKNASDIWGTSTGNGGSGFDPIGTYDGNSDDQGVVYHGVFNGNNFTIDQLYIDRPASDYVGLFGDSGANTTLENVNLTNVDVTGDYYVGALSAVADSTFNNDSSSGTVSGFTFVGNLIGIISGSLNTSYSTGIVNGAGTDIGGLAGYVQGGTVDSCYSTADVFGGTSSNVGGLIGINYGTVTNVFSTGSVSGGPNVGGLIGYNEGSVATSYTASPVTGSSNLGAFMGYNGGSISECLFDTQTAGTTSAVGSDPTGANVTGLTTAQLMSQGDVLAAAPNWNFSTVWTTNSDTTLPELIGVGGPGGSVSGNPGTIDSLSGMADNDLGAGADDVTLNLYYDGMLVGTTTTNSEGDYTVNLNSNDIMAGVLVIDATDQGNTYYQSNAPAATVTGVNVFANTLSLQGDGASNAALATALGSQTGIGANFSVSGSALATHTGIGMDVESNYTLDGNVSCSGQFATDAGSSLVGGTAATVTAGTVVLQGGLNRTGATAFNATAGDIYMSSIGASTQPATAQGLTLTASGNVSIDTCFINLGGGNFSATGSGYTSTTDENGFADGVDIYSSQIDAQGGNISLTGSGGYVYGPNHQAITAGYGIDFEDSTLETSGAGNITVNGSFNHNITSLSEIVAVEMYDDVVSVGAGAISLSGSVTAGTAAVNPDVDTEDTTKGQIFGVNIEGGSTIEATGTGGSVVITGNTSGGTSEITGGDFALCQGVGMDDSTASVASGGSLSITGTSSDINTTASTGTGGNQPITTGVLIEDGSTLTAGSNSAVTVVGTGGAIQTTGAYTGDSYGVYFSESNVAVGTGGTFSANGHAGAVNAGVGENAGDATSVGTQLDDSSITVANGSIALTGTGGTLDASQAGTLEGNVGAVSRGVLVFDGSEITGTGSTNVTFTGTGGNVTSGETLTGGSVGVNFGGNGEEVLTDISTESGSIQVTGTAGTAPALGVGVLISAFNGGETDVTSGGALTITGTGGSGYNGGGTIEGNNIPNYGVLVLDNVHLTTSTALSITGTAGQNSNAVELEELGSDNVFDNSPTLPTVNAGGGLAVTAHDGGVDYDGTANSSYTATFTTPGSYDSTIENAGGPYVLNGGSYTLTGGDISLSTGSAIGALDVTSDSSITLGAVHASSVTLSADTESDVTQTGALNTGALTINSAGDVILANTGNTISTLDNIESDGDISIYTASALTVEGQVSGFGDILLHAVGGNLVLGETSEISDFVYEDFAVGSLQPNSVENGQNVTLATNKNFLNNSALGGSVIQVGPDTNYDVYANSPSGTNLGGIPVDFTVYNTTYPDTEPPVGNGVLYATSANGGGGSGGGTTPPGTTAGGGTPIPPETVPQNGEIAPQQPSNGINLAQTDNSQDPGYSTTDGGIFTQTAATSSDLANFYGGSGQIDANDAAQLNNGELNNVSDPAASSVLDDALSPAVRSVLTAALTDIHFVEDTNAGDQSGVSGTAGEQVIDSGDVVEIGGGQVKQIPADQAPQPLKDALGNGVMNGLRTGAGH